MQVTHGCIRMYPEDIAELFGLVPVNTKVNLIDQRTKLGWLRGTLYMERHPPLEGGADAGPGEYDRVKEYVTVVAERAPVVIEWGRVEDAYRTQNGVPAPVTEPRARGVALVQPMPAASVELTNPVASSPLGTVGGL
jgi:L,D-transpeptidase ErfK/SrfK